MTLAEIKQTLLHKRGISNPDQEQRFFKPDYATHLYDPFLLPDMKKACERIAQAIATQEPIVIYSDYDSDGIPGGVLMHDFFKKINYQHFQNYIPHRHDEGFGLNDDAIDIFIQNKTKLLITIDCGITDVSEVARAAAGGIDVIITDHHIPHEQIPAAYAIINPKMPGNVYPFDRLCGAGIAWKLVCALIAGGYVQVPAGWEKWLLDMAGLATLSDMVPLVDENRVIAHYGLKVLRKSPRHGLMKLLSRMKIKQQYITEDDVGFMISPRINAASRLGHPMDAFHMLASVDPIDAAARAEYLITINDERKRLTASLSKQIESMLAHKDTIPAVIVAGNVDWKPGILGLVANSLAETHRRPVFLWGRDSGITIKGSVRSGNGSDIVALMKKVEHLFIDYGGHTASGGFSISHEHIDLLEQALNDAYALSPHTTAQEERVVDAHISLSDVTPALVQLLDAFAPFGLGNPKPLFFIQNISIRSVRAFGKGEAHTEVVLASGIKAIAFFKKPEHFTCLSGGGSVSLIGHIERSYWNGRSEIRIRIVDIV